MSEPSASEIQTLIEQFRESQKTITILEQKNKELQSTISQFRNEGVRKQVNFQIKESALNRIKREANRNGITQASQLAVVVETWCENNKDGNE